MSMTDFSIFMKALVDCHREWSRVPSRDYASIRAQGARGTTLEIRNSRVTKFERESNLALDFLAAQKKSSWKSAQKRVTSFDLLKNRDAILVQLLDNAVASDDPRPPRHEALSPQSLEEALKAYDCDIASMLPALVFHRAYQKLRNFVDCGLSLHLRSTWVHGARFWDRSPMYFLWVDCDHFMFCPRTSIDEIFTVADRDHEHISKSWLFHTHQFETVPSDDVFREAIEDIRAFAKAPLFDWTPEKFDAIVLSPMAAQKLFKHLIPRMVAQTPSLRLAQDIEILDDCGSNPSEDRFYVDDHAMIPKSIFLYRNRQFEEAPSEQNGHFVECGGVNIFCPVMRSSSKLSTETDEKILSRAFTLTAWIDDVVIQTLVDGSEWIQFPRGAKLYWNGSPAGMIAPPRYPIELERIVASMRPMTEPVFFEGVSAPALQILNP